MRVINWIDNWFPVNDLDVAFIFLWTDIELALRPPVRGLEPLTVSHLSTVLELGNFVDLDHLLARVALGSLLDWNSRDYVRFSW